MAISISETRAGQSKADGTAACSVSVSAGEASAGAAIIVLGHAYDAASATFTDDNATNETIDCRFNDQSYKLFIGSVLNAVEGTHNIAISNGGSTATAIHAWIVTGLATSSAYDTSAGQSASGNEGDSPTFSTAVADELIIGICSTGTATISGDSGAGFTEDYETYEGAYSRHFGTTAKVAGAAGSYKTEMGLSAPNTFEALGAAYKPAGAAVTFVPRMTRGTFLGIFNGVGNKTA